MKRDDNWQTSTDYLYESPDGEDSFVVYKMTDKDREELLVQRLKELHAQINVLSQELYKLSLKTKAAKGGNE